MPRTTQQGTDAFEAIEAGDLEKVFVVAQCLDNQWVPRALLSEMITKGWCLGDVSDVRDKQVRTEYLRALINAKQVVVNRAYIYNSPVVFKDYLRDGESRDAFIALLRSGGIVASLFSEQSPLDRPAYTTDPRGFPAWERLCRDARPKCVRLSWDNDRNKELIFHQLSRRFHDFAQTANSSDVNVFIRDLNLGPDARAGLKKRLIAVGQKCLEISGEDQLATREALYQAFVLADGTDVTAGKYDSGKPFAGAIKQLLDLSYNVNLPDALGGYALTPSDSLSRTSLQEKVTEQEEEIGAEELLDLLRRSAFALVQEGLYLQSVGSLSLKEVLEVRSTDEWARYILSLEELLRDPMQFPDPERGAAAVYMSYVKLAQLITQLVTKRRVAEKTAKWAPVAELVLDIAGAVVSVVWAPPAGIIYQLTGKVSATVSKKAAPCVARLVVRGLSESGPRADLQTSIDILHRRMQDAEGQWIELQARLREGKQFREATAAPAMGHDATINYPAGAYA
jgi:hypothetical protein